MIDVDQSPGPSPAAAAEDLDVQSSPSSTVLREVLETAPSTSRSTSSSFQLRRLGRLQLEHRLAVDIPDNVVDNFFTSCSTSSSNVLSQSPCSSHSSDKVTISTPSSGLGSLSPSDSSAGGLSLSPDKDNFNTVDPAQPTTTSAITSTASSRSVDDMLPSGIVLVDAAFSLLDDPIARFYVLLISIGNFLANCLNISPALLVAVIAVISLTGFHILRPRRVV